MSRLVRGALWVGFVYDFVLGVAGALMGNGLLEALGVTPANHAGYIQLLGLFVLVLGVMQLMAARQETLSRDLVLPILMMKLSYAIVTVGHFAFGGIPMVWLYFAVCDMTFACIFLYGLIQLSRTGEA